MVTICLILAAVLQFADLATTLWIIHHGGHEAWPPMAWLMAKLGTVEALFAKVAFVLTLLAIGWHFGIFQAVPAAAYAIAALYVAVVVHNLVVIARMRRRKGNP